MNIHDQINNADLTSTGRAAYAALTEMQDLKGAEQVTGAGLLFLLWCHRYGEDPRDVLAVCAHMFRKGLTENNQHILALKHFMKIDVNDPYAFTF